MKPTVYLETSIIGYLSSRPSGDLVTAANQKVTHDWWNQHREGFDLFTSVAVLQECGAGDVVAAAERLELLHGIPLLGNSRAAETLAQQLIDGLQLPKKAATDALHIALATVHGMNYLLTWNCTHIANASLMSRIQTTCRLAGFDSPTLCTPQQLLRG